MALTARGKQVIMDEGIDARVRYIVLALADGTPLNGHGYVPKAVQAADLAPGAGGVVTLPADLEIYVASDANAQRAGQVGLAEDPAGSILLYDYEDIEDTVDNPLPAAPGDGQPFRLTLTLNP